MHPPDFWRRKSDLRTIALSPLGWLFGAVPAIRRWSTTPYRASVPVLCIGNLVLGGAGKTPVAIDFGQRLAAAGKKVHFLTRGYGGKARGPLLVDPDRHTAADVGDEALLLARHAPTWMSANRPAGARMAADAGADIIVMDDGFQNPALAKDISLVVIDGGYGFGNGHVFPAGPLREPVTSGLGRADAVVVIGDGFPLAASPDAPPALRAAIEPGPEAADLAGTRVFAFAGIGRPQKFFNTLQAIGADVVGTRAFDDHYPYADADGARLLADAQALDARLVTTEKDFVRLPRSLRGAVGVLSIGLTWEDPAAVAALLAQATDGRP